MFMFGCFDKSVFLCFCFGYVALIKALFYLDMLL
jgi:hypothetical protein